MDTVFNQPGVTMQRKRIRFAEGMARLIWLRILKASHRGGRRHYLLHGNGLAFLPDPIRGALRRQVIRQDRFSRRIAVPLIKFSIELMIASFLVSACVYVATQCLGGTSSCPTKTELLGRFLHQDVGGKWAQL